MRRITILLTKYSDWISTLVYHLCGRGFTHSSLALDEDSGTFYSFNYRGFAVETLAKHRQRGVKYSRAIELQIPDAAYARIKARIEDVRAHRAAYRYTRLGVLCCLLRLPLRWERHYFCSQFVAELLAESGAVELGCRPGFCLPNRFAQELPRLPSCTRVLYDVV